MKKTNSTCPMVSAGFAALFMATAPAMAQTLFYDNFSGPLNPAWQASMPNFNEAEPYFGTPESATYLGAPNYAFQTLGGYSVLNMDDTMGNDQRYGWMTSTVFNAPEFIYQARFNTLTQSQSISIDAFLELSIFSSANNNLYDVASPFEAGYATNPQLAVGSSIDNTYGSQSFSFQNNTWYNLLIEAYPGQNIQVVLENDSGTPLLEQTLNHTASVYSSGFQIGLSQALGNPNGTYSTDVDVDYVELTEVPEPGSVALTVTGLVLLLGIAKKRRGFGRCS